MEEEEKSQTNLTELYFLNNIFAKLVQNPVSLSNKREK